MNEQEPQDYGLEALVNGEPILLTRHNTTLYTFFGRVILEEMEMDAANFNHVFVQLGEPNEEGAIPGGFIFQNNPGYRKVSSFILKHNFPANLNSMLIPQSDIDAWNRQSFGDLPDSLPEGFE